MHRTQDRYALSHFRQHFLVHSVKRGHLWREALRAYRAGEPGVPAREAIEGLANELDADS